MRRIQIEFTPAQARALLHRLTQGDCIADVFADTDGLEHLAAEAPARCDALAWELQTRYYVDVWRAMPGDARNPGDVAELDEAILREAVEGSTWPAIHDPANDTNNTPQAHAGACRTLWNAWERIANAYGLNLQDVEFPQA